MRFKLAIIITIVNIVYKCASKPTSVDDPNTLEGSFQIQNNDIVDEKLEFRSKYAKQMLTYMNLTINPCEDFYEYACGNWQHVKKDRRSHRKRNNFLDIGFELRDIVDTLLKESAESLGINNTMEWELARQFYDSCISAEVYPMKKSQVYIEEIKKAIGGFPAVHADWNAEEFSWFNASAVLNNYGVKSLIKEAIIPQYPFPLYFKLPELGIGYIVHSDNMSNDKSPAYVKNEQRIRDYLMANDVEETQVKEITNNIFEFYKAVLALMDTFDEDLSKCRDLGEENAEFEQWMNYYQVAWNGIDFGSDEMGCPCHHFYIELNKICNERKETVANYLALQFLYEMDARLEDKKYQKDYCTREIHTALPFIIDKVYMMKHLTSELRDEVANLVNEIRPSLRSLIENADWLDESSRNEALLKESTMTTRIGNFENIEMTERLIGEMRNLTIETSFESNNINLHKFATFMHRYNGLHFEELGNDTKPLVLLLGMMVNGFYFNVDNTINLMAGILYPPAYHSAWPNSLKFGTLGFLIGHELTHGFDSVGSMFDSNGEERSWWSAKSELVYEARTSCYVDHFNSYLITEINRNIDGELTKDENIADSGGLLEAFSAYKRYRKELYKEQNSTLVLQDERMPDMDLSPEQIFFLGYAQLWCAAYKEEDYWEELVDEHTMDKYRVLGSLSNNEDFAKAYECPIGSKMNSKATKCRLW